MFAIEKASLNKQLIAGTRWEILEPEDVYSASEYKLIYLFRSINDTSPKSFETSSNNGHLLALTPEQTAQLAGGYYNVNVFAKSLTDNEIIYPYASVVVYVQGDINTSADTRSFYQKMVEKIETVLLSLAEKTMDSVSVEGMTYNYKDIEKLERLADYYRYKAGMNGNQGGRRILIRFTNE